MYSNIYIYLVKTYIYIYILFFLPDIGPCGAVRGAPARACSAHTRRRRLVSRVFKAVESSTETRNQSIRGTDQDSTRKGMP